MAENPDASSDETEDYEYDLAHEATASPPLQRPAAPLPEPETMHAADDGGDYGYDAAHDLT
jgi:hypothetical protein